MIEGSINLFLDLNKIGLLSVTAFTASNWITTAKGRQTATVSSKRTTPKLNDEEILQTIVDLDRKLRRDYLPIFYLREKLQPPLSTEDLDEALFRLEKDGQIELSSITRGWRYTDEELEAGIPQRTGSRLFFITLK